MHRMTVLFPRFTRLFNQPDGAGGAGAGVATPPATPAAAPAGGSTPPGSGGPAASPGPGSTPQKYAYDEDRSNWINPNDPRSPYIPKHRYDEVAGRVRELSERDELMQRLGRALSGQDAPEDPRTAQIRDALFQVVPGLKDLLGVDFQALTQQTSEVQRAHWQRHGQSMTSEALKQIAPLLGREVKDLQAAAPKFRLMLRQFVEEDRTGQRAERYATGDLSLIDEFVSDVKGFWFTPAQQQSQQAAAHQAERVRRLPSTGQTGGVPPSDGPPKPQGKDVHEAARQDLNRRLGRA